MFCEHLWRLCHDLGTNVCLELVNGQNVVKGDRSVVLPRTSIKLVI